jgi:hypothetical protein
MCLNPLCVWFNEQSLQVGGHASHLGGGGQESIGDR